MFENEAIEAPPRFGSDFKLGKRETRRVRDGQDRQTYTTAQVLALLDAAERGVKGRRWAKGEKRRPGQNWSAEDKRQVVEAVCDRIALGEDVRLICRDPSMPDRRTLERWAVKDEAIAASLAHARVRQADADFEELRQWEYAAIADPKAAAGYRVAGELRRWRLGRLKPGAYGDHSTVQLTGHVQHEHHHEGQVDARLVALLGGPEPEHKKVKATARGALPAGQTGTS